MSRPGSPPAVTDAELFVAIRRAREEFSSALLLAYRILERFDEEEKLWLEQTSNDPVPAMILRQLGQAASDQSIFDSLRRRAGDNRTEMQHFLSVLRSMNDGDGYASNLVTNDVAYRRHRPNRIRTGEALASTAEVQELLGSVERVQVMVNHRALTCRTALSSLQFRPDALLKLQLYHAAIMATQAEVLQLSERWCLHSDFVRSALNTAYNILFSNVLITNWQPRNLAPQGVILSSLDQALNQWLFGGLVALNLLVFQLDLKSDLSIES